MTLRCRILRSVSCSGSSHHGTSASPSILVMARAVAAGTHSAPMASSASYYHTANVVSRRWFCATPICRSSKRKSEEEVEEESTGMSMAELRKQRQQDRDAIQALARRSSEAKEELKELSIALDEIRHFASTKGAPGGGSTGSVEERMRDLEKENKALRASLSHATDEIRKLSASVADYAVQAGRGGLGVGDPPAVTGVDPQLLRDILDRVRVLESKQYIGSEKLDKMAREVAAAEEKHLEPFSMRLDKETNQLGMVATRVEVSNLPARATVSDVRAHMNRAGIVLSCLVSRRAKLTEPSAKSDQGTETDSDEKETASAIPNKETERTVIVTYTSVHDAVRAVENLDCTQLLGSIIQVRPFLEPETTAVLTAPVGDHPVLGTLSATTLPNPNPSISTGTSAGGAALSSHPHEEDYPTGTPSQDDGGDMTTADNEAEMM